MNGSNDLSNPEHSELFCEWHYIPKISCGVFDSDSDAEHVHQYLRAAIKWSRGELTMDEYREASS
jgi:hypothetical protein